MNFLELAQRLHSEAGVAGATHTTVVGQTGMLGRLVNWILSAYEDIQNLRPGWKFMQSDFSFSTVASQQNYTKADAGVDDLASWKTKDVRLYSAVTDESELIYHPWDDFRLAFKTGSSRTQEGRPSVFSIKYDLSMDLWVIPDAVFTVNGEYFMQAQTMDEDDDEPIIPSQYHMILVWRALMFYGAKIGASEVYAHGNNEYGRILRRLELNQLPKFTWGKPLA